MISSTTAFVLLIAVIYFVARQRPKGDSGRLARVRKAGFVGFALLSVCLPLGVYDFFGFLFGWGRFLGGDICRAVVLQQVFESPKEMSSGIFWLWVVQQGLIFFSGFALWCLFFFYGMGVIFSEKNINCIRVQGYCLIISNLIDLEMQHLSRASSVSLTPIICGLLIIFIAWIMDEGRKIQEEQALTV